MAYFCSLFKISFKEGVESMCNTKHNVAKNDSTIPFEYRKVASSNTSCLEAQAGFFRLLMEEIFGPCVL